MPAKPKERYYGPGIGERSRDQMKGPLGSLRPGDVALSPDYARRLGLSYGDTFTYGGQNYRYADASYIRPGVPNTNTVEFWLPEGNSRQVPPPGLSSESSTPPPRESWTTSPGERRFLPSVGPTVETPTAPLRSAGDLDSEPSLFGSGSPSLEINAGETTRNAPHAAMDYVAPQVNRPHEAMNYVGGPSVETPTANPFDEWWRSTPVTGSASVDAGVSASDGGSIWSDNNTSLQDFGGDTSLGSDLSVDPSSLQFGERPAIELPAPDLPPIDETGVNQPPPPQPIGDEWTRSPEEQRFLPESSEPTAPAPRYSSSGGNIRDFGGQSFGNPLSLGAYLSTPLEVMRYGGDRYQPGINYGGRPSDLQPGEGYLADDVSAELGPGHYRDTPAGQVWVPDDRGSDNSNGTVGEPYYEGEAVSPEVRRPEEPEYRDFIDTGLTDGGTRWDPTQGRYVANNNATGAQHSQRAFNNMQMWAQSFGGNPNDYAGQSDELTNKRGEIGRLDEFGNYEQTGYISGRVDPESYRGLVSGSQRDTRRGITQSQRARGG